MCGKALTGLEALTPALLLLWKARYVAARRTLFVGKGEAIETTLAALQVVPEPFRSFANTLVDICAYAGQYSRHSYSQVSLCI